MDPYNLRCQKFFFVVSIIKDYSYLSVESTKLLHIHIKVKSGLITGRRSGATRGVSPVQLKEQRPIDEEIGASVDKEVINVRCLRCDLNLAASRISYNCQPKMMKIVSHFETRQRLIRSNQRNKDRLFGDQASMYLPSCLTPHSIRALSQSFGSKQVFL